MTITARPVRQARALPLPELPRRARDEARLTTNATLVAREDATDSLAVFTLELDEPLEPFAPGQYVSVGIVDGGQLLQRPYSVVSLTRGGRSIELACEAPRGRGTQPTPVAIGTRLAPARWACARAIQVDPNRWL